MDQDSLQKFQAGRRISERRVARASLEPVSHAIKVNEARGQVGDLPSSGISSRRASKKRQSEPPPTKLDKSIKSSMKSTIRLPQKRRSELSLVEDDMSNKRRQLSVSEDNIDVGINTRAKATPAPSAPKEPQTPQQEAPQPLSSPATSLSPPPSSPTLNAQAEAIGISASEVAAKHPEIGPSDKSKEVEPEEPRPGQSLLQGNQSTPGPNDTTMPDATPADMGAIPAFDSPTQLPTPPSSNPSIAETQDLSTAVKSSTRLRKKPEKYGSPDETFGTLEDIGSSSVPEVDEEEYEPSPTKKTRASTRAKTNTVRAPKPKSTGNRVTPVNKPVLGVAESQKKDTTSKTTTKSSPVAKPRGRQSKKIQVATNNSQEEDAVTHASKKLARAAHTKLDARQSLTTPKKTPASRKKSTATTSADAEPKPVSKTPQAPKAPRKKNIMNQASVEMLAKTSFDNSRLDQSKLALSQSMSRRELLESKPEPCGQPRVWAESRQALCETLPYFKKPQGGCYSNDGHVYGFLFDGVGHCREYLDENLILCRAGGSMEADSATGGMAQKKDQTMSEAQVQSIINDMELHNPVIVICGNRNIAAPTRMPHQYNVLGWFKPVFLWAEKTQGKGSKVWTTIKYRLERLNNHLESSWHAPNDNTLQTSDADRATAGPLFSKVCEFCDVESPQIYLQGWMCVNPGCDAFWEINGVSAPYGKEGLDYDPAFLLHRYPLWKNDNEEKESAPADVRPPVPKVGDSIGDNLYHINTRGVCCPECGRCNSRRKFSGWKCENPTCDWSFYPEYRPVLPAMLHTPWDVAPSLVRNRRADGVHIHIQHLYGYKISTYTFDGIEGSFAHIAATKQLNGEKYGPNEMFAALQTAKMGLERRVFAVTKMSGGKSDKVRDGQIEESIVRDDAEPAEESADDAQEFAAGDLMTAFSMNYGMPYKFVASGGSQAFEDAPWPVTECRRRLNWAQKTFLSNKHEYMDFNEQLIFAYLEGQKIEYHDDGESGLGPRIATLSLGGRAKMHMRVKAKHFVGCSKVGVFTEERPVPGSIDGNQMYRKRLEKWNELQTLKSDSIAYNRRRKEIPKELGIFEKKMKKAQDLVTVTLSHGDIIVMDGYDIQKYLEHKVVPEGHLRFALTCRTVLSNHLRPEERPTYQVEEDPVTYDGPNLSALGSE